MTVSELIKALSHREQDQQVRIEVCDAGAAGAHLYRIATVKQAGDARNPKREVWIRAWIEEPEWIP